MTDHSFLINVQQTLSAARRDGLGDEQLLLSDIAALTFSKAIVDRLEEPGTMKDAAWLSSSHHQDKHIFPRSRPGRSLTYLKT